MAKKSNHAKARARLGRMSPVHLAGALAMTGASFYAEVEPEPWQAKGKRPKKRIK